MIEYTFIVQTRQQHCVLAELLHDIKSILHGMQILHLLLLWMKNTATTGSSWSRIPLHSGSRELRSQSQLLLTKVGMPIGRIGILSFCSITLILTNAILHLFLWIDCDEIWLWSTTRHFTQLVFPLLSGKKAFYFQSLIWHPWIHSCSIGKIKQQSCCFRCWQFELTHIYGP